MRFNKHKTKNGAILYTEEGDDVSKKKLKELEDRAGFPTDLNDIFGSLNLK